MTKLDPRLVSLVQEVEKAAAQQARKAGNASPAAAPADAPVPCLDAKVDVSVWFTGSSDDLVAAGLELRWRERTERGTSFAAGKIAPSRLTELAAIGHVISIEPSEKMTPELSDSVPLIGVKALREDHAGATGAGVVIAIIDSGFDWKHGGFCDSTGRTRILAIWDNILTKQGGEVGFAVRDPDDPGDPNVPPKRLDEAGVYYDRDDINFSLGHSVTKANPVKVRTKDPQAPFNPKEPDRQSGHGTHVGGIAAGTGSPLPCCRPWGSGRYEGVAPGADIIVVRDNTVTAGIPAALSFIDEIAGAKPVVVNLSMGLNAGPHDGTTRAEKAIDRFVSKAGRIFVKSAGNEGNTKKHGRVTVPAQQAGPPPVPGIAELDVTIPNGMDEPDSMQIWYSQTASLELQLAVKDDGLTSAWLAQQGNIVFIVENGDPVTQLSAIATPKWHENDDRRILILASKHTGSSKITFTLRFRNAGAAPVVVDSWIAKGSKGLTFENPTIEGTLTTPGTALGAISVANHTLPSSSCDSGIAIHETSSRGPVRVVPTDATAPKYAKPTVAAPGTGITSAKPDGCRCWRGVLEDHYQMLGKGGTSMAAPHVAGVIALMLQQKQTLTVQDVRDLLDKHAKKVNGPLNAWGFGMLDAQKLYDAVAPPPPPTPPPSSPGAWTTPAALAPAGTAAPAPTPTSSLHPALYVLRETVSHLPDGELCAALISRHLSEVRRLINSNVKVAAMWHRADGPRMLRRLAVGAIEASAPPPLRGDGERAYLIRMLEQLHRYGSPALQTSIDRHQVLLLRMLESPLAAQLAAT